MQYSLRLYRFVAVLTACTLLFLLAACNSGSPSAPTGTGATPTSTPKAQSSPTTPGSSNPTPAPTPTSAMPPTQTSCPQPVGSGRAAVMRPLALGSDANSVYIFNQGSQTANGSFGELRRYDVRTGSKTVIVHLANETIGSAQVSNDGQWVLFLTTIGNNNAMQMIRMDGQGLQTLYCNTEVFNLQWSPDHSMVVFSSVASAKPGVSTSTLNMNTGQVLPELVPTQTQSQIREYSPETWVDNTRVYLIGICDGGTNCGLYILDTAKGPNQTPADLQQVVSSSSHYCSFDSDYNATKLVVSQNAGLSSSGCPPRAAYVGPSSIVISSITGGSPRSIYSSSQAIIQVRLLGYSSTSLLFVTDNLSSNTDCCQNTLWKINTDGTGLTRLITNNGSDQLNQFSQYPWSNVSLDGSMYVLEVDTPGSPTVNTLYYGSVNGGAPTAFAFAASGYDVEMAGWTRM